MGGSVRRPSSPARPATSSQIGPEADKNDRKQPSQKCDGESFWLSPSAVPDAADLSDPVTSPRLILLQAERPAVWFDATLSAPRRPAKRKLPLTITRRRRAAHASVARARRLHCHPHRHSAGRDSVPLRNRTGVRARQERHRHDEATRHARIVRLLGRAARHAAGARAQRHRSRRHSVLPGQYVRAGAAMPRTAIRSGSREPRSARCSDAN